jgi:signal peptidase I
LSVNFPLFLVIATGLCGAIWMLDALVLRPRSKGDPQESANWVVEYAISFFPVLLFVLVLRSFLVEPFQIPTGSMIPTLKVGDFILVNKYAYGIRLPVAGTKIIDVGDPERGDSMVFIPPHEEEYFIKRVIGLPGDRVRYQNKTLYINGVEQTQVFQQEVREFRPRQLEFEETFGDKPHAIYRNLYNDPRVQEWVVPEGHYFMMGDNRDQSNDSRFWGFVPDENVVGRAFAVWMHKDPGLSMPTFSTTRWIR